MKPDKNSPEFAKAISVEEMRLSDAYTIANITDSKTLMYRAAMGIYDNMDKHGKNIAIVCGSGNNGGDGYALAGILADNGIMPHIYRVSDKFSEDGLYYCKIAEEKNVEIYTFSQDSDFSAYDTVVDCILGTGFEGTPRGNVAEAIKKINSSGAYVVSADINSGLNGDTGEAVLAVKSDLTVSIGFYKKGMFTGEAPKLIGELVNTDIGIQLI